MTMTELSNRLTSNTVELRLDPRFMETLVDERSQDDVDTIGEELSTRQKQLVETAVALFKDAEETCGLVRFLMVLDAIDMGHSVDLMIWLRRWRAA